VAVYFKGKRVNDISKNRLSVDQLIGRRVRDLRTATNKLTDDVAAYARMSVVDYARAEKGERGFRAIELFSVAKCLGIHMKDIISEI
jgi:transcriptional regulator with XRE-family HTH domain